jgi:excisionase family DNA binding protein
MGRNKGEVMTIDELESYLKVLKPTLYKLAQNGKAVEHRIGRHWRFKRDIIEKSSKPF